jgi:hypothetical protein
MSRRTHSSRSAVKSRHGGAKARRWSQAVTQESNALDLEPGVFTLDDAAEIAASLKRSALSSQRRKSEPFRSAMSMLTFYINRAGRNLSSARRKVLERAKQELRSQFGKAR